MGALGYLYRKTFINRIKMALKKPITYFYIVFVAVYMVAVPFSFKMLLEEFGGASPSGMAMVLTLFGFWLLPTNLISFAKRKGLTYRNPDVHFLFPSPISPKQILLYAHLKTLVMGTLVNIVVCVLGALLFHVELWKVLIYFLFSMGIDNVLEGSIMMVVYGTEKVNDSQRKWIVKFAYALLLVFLLMAVYTYATEGLSLESVAGFLHSDMVQLVPITGWYIAVVHLIFMGPTVVNVIGAVCFLALTVVMLVTAIKMNCSGLYYEDAIKFAEDYEEALKKSKEGGVARVGKKQKFNKAKIEWKGFGAKALFYRQLLEYKKSKFFIFDVSTLVALLAGVGVVYLYISEGGFGEEELLGQFILPGLAAYIIFIFSNLNGKWAKELKSPYTYLIPDTSFKKLMYATAMQHVQSLINAILLLTPGTIVMKLSPVTYIFSILFYVLLSANKLYSLAVAEIIAGNTLGVTGKQLLQLLIQGFAIGSGVLGAILGYSLSGIISAYICMDVFLFLFTAIFAVIATLNFERLETA